MGEERTLPEALPRARVPATLTAASLRVPLPPWTPLQVAVLPLGLSCSGPRTLPPPPGPGGWTQTCRGCRGPEVPAQGG